LAHDLDGFLSARSVSMHEKTEDGEKQDAEGLFRASIF